MTPNSAAAPTAPTDAGFPSIAKVASGYNLVFYAILLWFGAMFFAILVYAGDIWLPVAIGNIALVIGTVVSLTLALIGLLRVLSGLGYARRAQILFVIVMCVPLIDLVILLWLNRKVTKALRAAGFRYTFIGVSKRA